MLSSKWNTLNHNCQKFNAIYKRCSRLIKSGESELDVMKQTRAVYRDENKNTPFSQEDAWEVLRKHSKWDALAPAPVDLTEDEERIVNTDELFGPDARPRPLCKQCPGKKIKSDTSESTGRSSSSSQFGDVMTNELRLKREVAEVVFEVAKEKDRTVMRLEEMKFLTISTKDLSENDTYFIEEQKEAIRAKYNLYRNRGSNPRGMKRFRDRDKDDDGGDDSDGGDDRDGGGSSCRTILLELHWTQVPIYRSLVLGFPSGQSGSLVGQGPVITVYTDAYAFRGRKYLIFRLASFFARLFKMTNFAVKHSIMTPEMVENFCNDYYIPDEVHPVASGRDKTITQFSEGKVGVYTRFFDYCGYRIPFTKFLMVVLRYFRIHISQLSPFGAARVSHFKVLTRVLDLAPSITVFRAFYTRTYSDGLFSFAKRSPSSPFFPKPLDSIKNWSDHFFWVDAKVFPIPVSLYVGGTLEKDPAPHLTNCQAQTVRLLENNKAPFRRYPECFLCLVGLSPYYPFDENTYSAFERSDGTDIGLLDFIKTADPWKVQAVEVQKKDDQVKLLESTSHCFMSLGTPAAGGSSSAAAPEDTPLDLTEPDEFVTTQSRKSKRKRLVTQSDTLPAKQLRKDHPSLATGTGGKTLAGLRQLMPTSPPVLSARSADVPVYTAAATVTSARENVGITPMSDVAGSSQLETSEGSDDSFYKLPGLNSAKAKRWYIPRWNITNDSLLDDGAARQICLESEVKSSAEHELELKEKLKGKYDARGSLLEEKDLEILIHKSLLAEEAERAETTEGVRLRGQVYALIGEVSVLKSFYPSHRLSEHAHVLYNRVVELEAHVMDVSGRLEGELYPAYLTTLAERRWFLTHEIQLAMIKCLKSPEYQSILGHALGRAVDFGMQEGLEAGYEHGVAGTQLSEVEAYNREAARTSYFNAVRALEDVEFPLVNLLKSKKDAGMDEVLDCFILDGPLADLPEVAYLQPCLEQLSAPIHHSNDKAIVRETSLSFALLNVHSRAEGAKKHAAALLQLMMEIVSNPLSSQTWVGETSTSAAPLFVEDFDEVDTDEALGSVVAIPKFEDRRF
ncbi:hypothetical protein Tco_0558275 [Tanacetum coccineum]